MMDNLTLILFVAVIVIEGHTLPTAKPTTTTTKSSTGHGGSIDCNFTHDQCGWTQDRGDNLDWTRHKGGTTTRGTGPSKDHTTGASYYMYLDTSKGYNKAVARLISPPLTLIPGHPKCLTFWYNMYGKTVNNLNVYLARHGHLDSAAWGLHDNQGPAWQQAKVDITGASPLQVVFEASRGTSSAGDIAIDDIRVINGLCSVSFDCAFESGICEWKQGFADNFDWTLHRGPTQTNHTGPSGDHTTGSGHYIYTESSQPRIKDEQAVLISPVHPPTTGQCLQFYYNMYGTSMGTLNVFVQPVGGSPVKIWTKSENTRQQKWLLGETDLKVPSSFTIVFVGLVRGGYYSDMAIDDIKVTNMPCGQKEPSATTKPTVKTTIQTTTHKHTGGLTSVTSSALSLSNTTNRSSSQTVPVTTPVDFREAIHLQRFHRGWFVTVDLNKLVLRPTDVSNIYMAKDSCTGILQADLLVFNKTYGQCDTHAEATEGKMTFSNYLLYVIPNAHHAIRNIRWEYKIQCSHALYANGTLHITPKLNVTKQGFSSGQVAGSPFEVSMFKDATFKEPLEGTAAIGSTVYVQVLSLSHPDVVMVLDSCEASVKATNPDTQRSYPLIEHHCSVESTTNILIVRNQLTRFKFDMFDLPNDHEGIYVTCDVHFCDQMDFSPRCEQRCLLRQNPVVIG